MMPFFGAGGTSVCASKRPGDRRAEWCTAARFQIALQIEARLPRRLLRQPLAAHTRTRPSRANSAAKCSSALLSSSSASDDCQPGAEKIGTIGKAGKRQRHRNPEGMRPSAVFMRIQRHGGVFHYARHGHRVPTRRRCGNQGAASRSGHSMTTTSPSLSPIRSSVPHRSP